MVTKYLDPTNDVALKKIWHRKESKHMNFCSVMNL